MNRNCLPRLARYLALIALAVPLALASGVAAFAAKRETPLEAAHTIKPTAPIGIAHAFEAAPQVGVPVTFTVSVTAGEPLTNGVLVLGVPEGLTRLDPVAADVALGGLAAGDTTDIEVTVLPLAAADYRLSLTVSGAIRGQPQSRTVTVTIRLAPAVAPKPGDASDPAAGKSEPAVRSFSATETVR
jgi:hypothetical protein